jgi:hypothetical protein
MIRPSGGVGWREFVEMICPTGEAKYFCKGDWSGGITLIRFNKFDFTRKRRTLAGGNPVRHSPMCNCTSEGASKTARERRFLKRIVQ